MKNVYGSVLAAILVMSTVCFSAESGEPSVAIITGEIREPTSREITFSYDSPVALGKKAEQRVALDSRNRFTLEIPVVRGILVRGSYKSGGITWKPVRQAVAFLLKPSPLVFFVEPGDSLVIPPRWRFQFSASAAEELCFLCFTVPPWPGGDEAHPAQFGGLGPGTV